MPESESAFQEKEVKAKAHFLPKGKSGTLVSAFQVENDHLPELLGVEGIKQYKIMSRSDSQIRKLMHSVNNPIKSANWSIEPASDSDDDIKKAALMEQIIFKDIEGGWTSKLDEILDFPWFSHAVFEPVHKNRNKAPFGNYTGLEALAWRDQETLDEWVHDRKTGKLLKIHQKQDGDIPVNEYMDAENLIIFYNEKKGDDKGFPFLRMLYGNYKRKLMYKELQAIGIERAAIPVPHLELPDGVAFDSEQAENAEEQLRQFTQAESAYFMTPYGYKLKYDCINSFDPSKVQTAIKAENEEIVGSLVGMWLEMGIGGNSGNQAGTGISAEFFKDGIEYIADKIKDKINLELIPKLMALNYGEVDSMPKLQHSGISDESGKELMEIVTGYVKAGVITPDEPLEDHVRSGVNLPKKAEGEMLENGTSQDGEKEDDTGIDDTSDESIPNDNPDEDVELSTKKAKVKTPRDLMISQSETVSDILRMHLRFSSDKYINDVMSKFDKLSEDRKQSSTNKVEIGGKAKLRKDLRTALSTTFVKAVNQVKNEIPSARSVELSTKPDDLERFKFTGDEIHLNDNSSLPTHVQILLAKQSELISDASMEELKTRLDFTFSSIATKAQATNIVRQALEDSADKFIEANVVNTKSTNVVALTVNEGRNTFFFDDDVRDLIHSFTFVNFSPVSPICKELAGTVFKVNDAESLRFSPPLHHNCKSYLRANLKVSKGIENLDISKLAPSATAQKSITL